MKASVSHIQINVSDKAKSFLFYKELLGYFDYRIIHETDEYLGMTNGATDFWTGVVEEKYRDRVFHRKAVGLNHVAFRVQSKDDVGTFCKEFLVQRNIPTLYNSPKSFPEYDKNYYAVYFEDPDRIKLEVVYF